MKTTAFEQNHVLSEDSAVSSAPPQVFGELNDAEKELLIRYREDPSFREALDALLLTDTKEGGAE